MNSAFCKVKSLSGSGSGLDERAYCPSPASISCWPGWGHEIKMKLREFSLSGQRVPGAVDFGNRRLNRCRRRVRLLAGWGRYRPSFLLRLPIAPVGYPAIVGMLNPIGVDGFLRVVVGRTRRGRLFPCSIRWPVTTGGFRRAFRLAQTSYQGN